MVKILSSVTSILTGKMDPAASRWQIPIKSIKKLIYLPIAPIGWPLVLAGIGSTLLFGILGIIISWLKIFLLSLAASIACLTFLLAWFFRDPERQPENKIPLEPKKDFLISPADGKITDITPTPTHWRIGIFLSIFDCHVQRIPISGQVAKIEKKEGKFLAAFNPKASTENVSTTTILKNPFIGTVLVRQIVGLLARRIITLAQEGTSLKRGEKLGMIVLGSRVELEIPKSMVELTVNVGDRVQAGKTIVGTYDQ